MTRLGKAIAGNEQKTATFVPLSHFLLEYKMSVTFRYQEIPVLWYIVENTHHFKHFHAI